MSERELLTKRRNKGSVLCWEHIWTSSDLAFCISDQHRRWNWRALSSSCWRWISYQRRQRSGCFQWLRLLLSISGRVVSSRSLRRHLWMNTANFLAYLWHVCSSARTSNVPTPAYVTSLDMSVNELMEIIQYITWLNIAWWLVYALIYYQAIGYNFDVLKTQFHSQIFSCCCWVLQSKHSEQQ